LFTKDPLNVGNSVAPESATVIVRLEAGLELVSDQNSRLCVPSGATSRKSRSNGKVCENPVTVTETSVTVPAKPLAVTVLCTAAPLGPSGIVPPLPPGSVKVVAYAGRIPAAKSRHDIRRGLDRKIRIGFHSSLFRPPTKPLVSRRLALGKASLQARSTKQKLASFYLRKRIHVEIHLKEGNSQPRMAKETRNPNIEVRNKFELPKRRNDLNGKRFDLSAN
jgi:hypothetical protein